MLFLSASDTTVITYRYIQYMVSIHGRLTFKWLYHLWPYGTHIYLPSQWYCVKPTVHVGDLMFTMVYYYYYWLSLLYWRLKWYRILLLFIHVFIYGCGMYSIGCYEQEAPQANYFYVIYVSVKLNHYMMVINFYN